MSLVFYYAPQSSASPVHWTLEELGIPYEKVKIDLQSGGQNAPDFLAINPNAKIPAIVHDGTPIFESAAIQIYLGETFGVEKGLFPAPGPRRGEAMKWIVWCNVSLGEALSRYMHNTSPRIPAERHNAKAGEVAKADVEKLLGVLDGALKGREFLLGEVFSIADLHLAGWVAYLGMVGIDTKSRATVAEWAARCCARPAYAKIMQP